MTTLFQTPNIEDTIEDDLTQDQKDYLNELVGEGKKFKTVQDLARGKATSDGFIEQLKRELSDLRTELRSRKTVEEVLAERTSRNVNEPNPANNQQELGDDVNNKPLGLKDLESLLDRKLTEKEQLTARQRNLDQVKNALVDNWGSNYPQKLMQVARENGYSQQMLDQMAQENPNAFFRLVDLKPSQTTNNFNLPVNSRSTERTLGTTRKPGNGWTYWQARKKEIGESRYYSPKEQQALWSDLQKFSSEEDFYNS